MKFLDGCISHLREVFGELADPRRGRNSRYALSDIVMAAFSMFFMQHPSFLSFQRSLHENTGKDNTRTLFEMEKIPTDNHIRQTLDGMDPDLFSKAFFYIIDRLAGMPNAPIRNMLGGHTLIALDGSEYFCSKKINCDSCSKRMRNDGEQEYFHTFLAASIVTPVSKSVLSLPAEFVRPQDGASKQDCEWNAAVRWLDRLGEYCSKYEPIYLGDDLYAKQEICAKILAMKGNFIFTCKDSSHKTLCEFRKGLVEKTWREVKGKGSQRREYTYNFIPALPLRDGKAGLLVNWFEVIIAKPGGKQTYHSSFITNLVPTEENIAELASCARARWKIENGTFNVLKNNGYHLEHNFGHGKRTLASVLVVINLLAFSLHNAAEIAEKLWQEARAKCGTRVRLFNVMNSLTAYLVYPSWRAFMSMIVTGRLPPPV